METTFAIIKPAVVADKQVGKILTMIEDHGFEIAAMQKITMTQAQAEELYQEHKARPFFNGLVSIMTHSPIVILALKKEHAVSSWRDLMGATNPANALPGTVRALFGKNLDANASHGSDSPASAARELGIFFPNL